MYETTHPQGIQTPSATKTAGGEERQGAQRRHRIEAVLWVIGIIAFLISAFIIHAHPKPYAIDLSSMETAQSLQLWPWVNPILEFPSKLNDPLPSAIALSIWLAGMLLVALFFRVRRMGRAALSWCIAALFLVAAVMSSAGLNTLVDIAIGRPRPDPHLYPIHVYTPIVPFPTYPSGHTEHDIVYYGFLLYLSFTRPVREWKYRWLLLPLQLYAVFDLLSIGYSRILEGDHWLTDVLGGYLEGLIYLFAFIFLYRWVTGFVARRYARKHPAQAAAHQS